MQPLWPSGTRGSAGSKSGVNRSKKKKKRRRLKRKMTSPSPLLDEEEDGSVSRRHAACSIVPLPRQRRKPSLPPFSFSVSLRLLRTSAPWNFVQRRLETGREKETIDSCLPCSFSLSFFFLSFFLSSLVHFSSSFFSRFVSRLVLLVLLCSSR